MLIEKLKQWEYYYKKLPLYVRNSYGIKDHFEMIFDMMIEMDINEEEICNCFNLLQDNYISNIIIKYDEIDGYDFKFLDMIADIYGVSRSLDATYINENNVSVTEQLKLTNEELYTFIKARIIQNNYDGSYEQAIQYYDNIGLNIQLFFDSTEPAKCDIYLDLNKLAISKNIQALFLAGLLTIKSVGITYNERLVDFDKAGIWDGTGNHSIWDVTSWL